MAAYVKALGLGVHRHGVVGKCRPSPDEDETLLLGHPVQVGFGMILTTGISFRPGFSESTLPE